MGGGGQQAPAPQPSSEERALQAQQTEALKQQNAILQKQYQEQRLIAPYLYKQAGLTPITDDAGNITGFTQQAEPAEDEITKNQKQITLLDQQRSLAALRGELPVDPALTRSLDEQEKTLHNTLRGQLGTDYLTSSAGIEALDRFTQSKNNLLDASRRGDLSLAQALGIQSQQASEQTQAQLMGRLSGAVQSPLTTAQAFGQNAQGFGGAAGIYGNQSALAAQVASSNAQLRSANRGQLLGAGAGLAGAGIAAAAII